MPLNCNQTVTFHLAINPKSSLFLNYPKVELAYVWLLNQVPTNGDQLSQVFPVKSTPPLPLPGSLDLKEEYDASDGDPQEGNEEQGKRDARALVHLAIATAATVGGVAGVPTVI